MSRAACLRPAVRSSSQARQRGAELRWGPASARRLPPSSSSLRKRPNRASHWSRLPARTAAVFGPSTAASSWRWRAHRTDSSPEGGPWSVVAAHVNRRRTARCSARHSGQQPRSASVRQRLVTERRCRSSSTGRRGSIRPRSTLRACASSSVPASRGRSYRPSSRSAAAASARGRAYARGVRAAGAARCGRQSAPPCTASRIRAWPKARSSVSDARSVASSPATQQGHRARRASGTSSSRVHPASARSWTWGISHEAETSASRRRVWAGQNPAAASTRVRVPSSAWVSMTKYDSQRAANASHSRHTAHGPPSSRCRASLSARRSCSSALPRHGRPGRWRPSVRSRGGRLRRRRAGPVTEGRGGRDAVGMGIAPPGRSVTTRDRQRSSTAVAVSPITRTLGVHFQCAPPARLQQRGRAGARVPYVRSPSARSSGRAAKRAGPRGTRLIPYHVKGGEPDQPMAGTAGRTGCRSPASASPMTSADSPDGTGSGRAGGAADRRRMRALASVGLRVRTAHRFRPGRHGRLESGLFVNNCR